MFFNVFISIHCDNKYIFKLVGIMKKTYMLDVASGMKQFVSLFL